MNETRTSFGATAALAAAMTFALPLQAQVRPSPIRDSALGCYEVAVPDGAPWDVVERRIRLTAEKLEPREGGHTEYAVVPAPGEAAGPGTASWSLFSGPMIYVEWAVGPIRYALQFSLNASDSEDGARGTLVYIDDDPDHEPERVRLAVKRASCASPARP